VSHANQNSAHANHPPIHCTSCLHRHQLRGGRSCHRADREPDVDRDRQTFARAHVERLHADPGVVTVGRHRWTVGRRSRVRTPQRLRRREGRDRRDHDGCSDQSRRGRCLPGPSLADGGGCPVYGPLLSGQSRADRASRRTVPLPYHRAGVLLPGAARRAPLGAHSARTG